MSRLNEFVEIVNKEYFGFESQIKVALLSAVSAMRGIPERKVNVFFYGAPGCGKTKLVNTVGKLLPRYSFVTYASPKWLSYAENEIEDDSVLAFDEARNIPAQGLALMRSKLGIDRTGSVIGTVHEHEGLTLRNDKNFVAWMNAVEVLDDEQLMDRFISIELKPNQQHREQVRRYQQRLPQIEDGTIELTRAFFVDLWKAKPKVVVPFYIVAEDSSTRLFQLTYNLFEAFVLINNFNPEEPEKDIVASKNDFVGFKDLVEATNLLRRDNWSELRRNVYDLLTDTDSNRTKTFEQIEEELRSRGIAESSSTIRRELYELREYVSYSRSQHGKHLFYLGKQLPSTSGMEVSDDTESGETTSA